MEREVGGRRGATFAGRRLGTCELQALAGFVTGMWRRPEGPAAPPTAVIKLAVLPFANLTGDPEQEYFSDGLTAEMIARLGRLHPQGLAVIARTSVMRYKNTDKAIDQIGRELGVEYILEGSSRREANRVRITSELIRVRDQTQVWADSADRELAAILALQSDVARGVAGSLAFTLLAPRRSRSGQVPASCPRSSLQRCMRSLTSGIALSNGWRRASRYAIQIFRMFGGRIGTTCTATRDTGISCAE